MVNPEKEISGSIGTFRHSGATTIALTLLAGRFNAPTATWLSASVITAKRAPKILRPRGVSLTESLDLDSLNSDQCWAPISNGYRLLIVSRPLSQTNGRGKEIFFKKSRAM